MEKNTYVRVHSVLVVVPMASIGLLAMLSYADLPQFMIRKRIRSALPNHCIEATQRILSEWIEFSWIEDSTDSTDDNLAENKIT